MVATLSKDTHLAMYQKMSLIKQNDDKIQFEMKTGKLMMPYYSARGQEVIPAAVSVNLNPDDYLVTVYRGIHDSLAKGLPLKDLWAELAGRITGTCKGKGGPMHITHPETGVMVTTGIVGSGIPIACGLALSSYYKKDGRVTISNFGDGASNIGAFHEGLNLASIWQLPVVFVCANNRYAEHSAYEMGTACESVAKRADSYNMPGIRVDGNDPEAMHAVAKEAIDRARNGGGPTLIEAMTFRFCGHNIGDDSHYIPAEEMAAAKEADPLPRYRLWLQNNGFATEAELADMEATIAEEINAAKEYAYSCDIPGAEELKRDVYAHELA
tara:strand:- start:3103 stop:4080 length:978 start_codon:yes stop_codon:yes gene_type:complete